MVWTDCTVFGAICPLSRSTLPGHALNRRMPAQRREPRSHRCAPAGYNGVLCRKKRAAHDFEFWSRCT